MTPALIPKQYSIPRETQYYRVRKENGFLSSLPPYKHRNLSRVIFGDNYIAYWNTIVETYYYVINGASPHIITTEIWRGIKKLYQPLILHPLATLHPPTFQPLAS